MLKTKQRLFKKILLLSSLAATILGPAATASEPEYPTQQPVTIIVAFPPGSGSDGAARFFAEEFYKATGQNFIVENRPGGNSFIAARTLARAVPDGYTIGFISDPMLASNAAVFKDLPYDPLTDYDPIAKVVTVPNMIVTSTQSGWKTLSDLTEASQNRPDGLTFGMGSASYAIVGEGFLDMAGIRGRMIPYGSPIQALTDIAKGEIDMMIVDTGTAGALLRGDKVVPIAVTTDTRHPLYPNVPTVQELGFPNYNYSSWGAFYAPTGTPEDKIAYLEKLVESVTTSKRGKEFFATRGTIANFKSANDLRDFHKNEINWWKTTAQEVGFQAQ